MILPVPGYARRRLILGSLILLLLSAVRVHQSAHPLTTSGPLVVLDRGLDLLLVALLLFLALCLGRWILRPLQWEPPSPLTEAIWCMAIGLGVVAYAIWVCGLVGLLSTPTLLALLALLVLLTCREFRPSLALLGQVKQQIQQTGWPPAVPLPFLILLGLLLSVGLIQALGPPGGYDALSYHLAAPKRFIEAGRIIPWPENHPANFPFLIEMLYLGGMLLGSDVLATVLHYALGLTCVLFITDLARQHFSPHAAWLTASLYIATPLVFFLMQIAYVDFGLALYELLAVGACIEWLKADRKREQRSWLILAGAGCGFALGVRYFAGALPVLLVCYLVAVHWRQPIRALGDILALCIPTTLIALPWYIKNLIWLGNPVFPFYFGGPEWDPARVQRFAYINDLHGSGHQLADYLRLPLDLVIHTDRFGTVLSSYTSILWWLPLLALPLARRDRVLRLLLFIGYARLALWALSVQQVRYFVPYLALLYLALGALLDWIMRRYPGPWVRRMIYYLLTFFVMTGLILQLLFFCLGACPLPVILGLESRQQFLARHLTGYAAMDYINHHTPTSTQVLFVGEGRGYYCERAYIPDITLETWSYVVSLAPARTPAAVYQVLCDRGITHILVEDYASWWLEQFDPLGAIQADLQILQALQPQYMELIYDAGYTRVYRLR